MSALPVLAFLVACGGAMKEDDFQDQIIDKTCALQMECGADTKNAFFDFESEEECAVFYHAFMQLVGDEEGCEYDGEAARECVAAYDDATCDNLDTIEDEGACADVYSDGCFDTLTDSQPSQNKG